MAGMDEPRQPHESLGRGQRQRWSVQRWRPTLVEAELPSGKGAACRRSAEGKARWTHW